MEGGPSVMCVYYRVTNITTVTGIAATEKLIVARKVGSLSSSDR